MGKSLRDVGRERKHRAGYEPTVPQVIMRSEIESRLFEEDGLVTAGTALGAALDELFVPEAIGIRPVDSPVAGSVTKLALQLIDEGPNLQLSLGQWAIVQELVERAIRTGHKMGELGQAAAS